jgi:hypothetical protein
VKIKVKREGEQIRGLRPEGGWGSIDRVIICNTYGIIVIAAQALLHDSMMEICGETTGWKCQ